ncbi:MAG TPA: cupin domain-containing protein [Cellvibrionaceae bacterium]
MKPTNILASLPQNLETETFEDIIRSQAVRIERIVSKGHASPEHGWYDQKENEWVMVVKGSARLEFADGSHCDLSAGDYVNIPAHVKHKVASTDAKDITVWLAIFYT